MASLRSDDGDERFAACAVGVVRRPARRRFRSKKIAAWLKRRKRDARGILIRVVFAVALSIAAEALSRLEGLGACLGEQSRDDLDFTPVPAVVVDLGERAERITGGELAPAGCRTRQ